MILKTNADSHLRIKLFLVLVSVVFMFYCVSTVVENKYSNKKTAYLPDDTLINQTDTNNKNGSAENTGIKVIKPREVTVVIDPGHGGEDWGTYYKDIYEKDLNLDVSLKLGGLLQKSGVKVVYTREKDEFVGLRERSDIANKLEADLFISIHHNKMPDNPYYKGTETLYCPSGNTAQDTMNGEKFAAIVQKELVKTLGTIDNGTIYRPNLSVLRHTKMPAVISEIGYLSNSSDRDKITSPAFRQKAAEALSSAILKTLEKMEASKNTDGKWMLADG